MYAKVTWIASFSPNNLKKLVPLTFLFPILENLGSERSRKEVPDTQLVNTKVRFQTQLSESKFHVNNHTMPLSSPVCITNIPVSTSDLPKT